MRLAAAALLALLASCKRDPGATARADRAAIVNETAPPAPPLPEAPHDPAELRAVHQGEEPTRTLSIEHGVIVRTGAQLHSASDAGLAPLVSLEGERPGARWGDVLVQGALDADLLIAIDERARRVPPPPALYRYNAAAASLRTEALPAPPASFHRWLDGAVALVPHDERSPHGGPPSRLGSRAPAPLEPLLARACRSPSSARLLATVVAGDELVAKLSCLPHTPADPKVELRDIVFARVQRDTAARLEIEGLADLATRQPEGLVVTASRERLLALGDHDGLVALCRIEEGRCLREALPPIARGDVHQGVVGLVTLRGEALLALRGKRPHRAGSVTLHRRVAPGTWAPLTLPLTGLATADDELWLTSITSQQGALWVSARREPHNGQAPPHLVLTTQHITPPSTR